MKICLFLFLLFSAPCLFAQEEPVILNGMKYDPALVLPVLQTLHEQNDYVIAFRTVLPSASGTGPDYFILSSRNNKYQAYSYSSKAAGLVKLKVNDASLDLIWKTFLQNELFSMRDEKDIANFCAGKYHIYNSYTYEFMILSKERMKILSYYNPEYYDEACFGMDERRKIINSVSVIQFMYPLEK